MSNTWVLPILFSAMLLIGPTFEATSATRENALAAPLVFAGSGTCLPIMRLLADEYMRNHPGVDIEVPSSIGSGGAIRAYVSGAISAGLISRDLDAMEESLGLTLAPFARTAVVFATHPSVKDNDITFEDITAIYSGLKSRWSDDMEIIVLTREPQDSAILAIGRMYPLFKSAHNESYQKKRWTVLFTDAEMNSAIANTPGSIGLTDAGAIAAERLNVKALSLNGVMPLPENLKSGKYPPAKILSFVFHEARLSEKTKAFIEFVRSEEGKRIVEHSGYLTAE